MFRIYFWWSFLGNGLFCECLLLFGMWVKEVGIFFVGAQQLIFLQLILFINLTSYEAANSPQTRWKILHAINDLLEVHISSNHCMHLLNMKANTLKILKKKYSISTQSFQSNRTVWFPPTKNEHNSL